MSNLSLFIYMCVHTHTYVCIYVYIIYTYTQMYTHTYMNVILCIYLPVLFGGNNLWWILGSSGIPEDMSPDFQLISALFCFVLFSGCRYEKDNFQVKNNRKWEFTLMFLEGSVVGITNHPYNLFLILVISNLFCNSPV